MRYGRRIPEEACRSLPALIRDIYAHEGLRGLYKGALPSIIKAAPAAAVTFAAYEVILKMLVQPQLVVVEAKELEGGAAARAAARSAGKAEAGEGGGTAPLAAAAPRLGH
jgi:hypothetical protein